MDFDDTILKELKVAWENAEPHLRNLSILIENQSILEREGDESRRKVAEDFLTLIKGNVDKVKPELVKISNDVGLFLNYSQLLNEKFELIFYPFDWIQIYADQKGLSQQDFYKNVDIILQPSDTTENYPRVGFEAMR